MSVASPEAKPERDPHDPTPYRDGKDWRCGACGALMWLSAGLWARCSNPECAQRHRHYRWPFRF